jgi:hypothetical protein
MLFTTFSIQRFSLSVSHSWKRINTTNGFLYFLLKFPAVLGREEGGAVWAVIFFGCFSLVFCVQRNKGGDDTWHQLMGQNCIKWKAAIYHQNKGQNVLISRVHTTSFWQDKTISFVNFIFAPCILTNTPLPHLYFKIYNITPVIENFPSSCITTFFLVRLHCYYFLKFIQSNFIEKIIYGYL